MSDIDLRSRVPSSPKRDIRRRKAVGTAAAIFGLPLATAIGLFVAWEILVPVFDVPGYILPVPSGFFRYIFEEAPLLWSHTRVTATEIIWGFIIATATSIPLGLLIATVKWIERAFYPIIVFFQIIPKIAIAPLFIIWFGFGIAPKILITFLLCFFPTLVSSIFGFKAVGQQLLYITQSMGATRWQTFRYIRLPVALPHIFSGLQVSIVLASTGAIVGEFVGAQAGLGYLLMRGTAFLNTELVFAALAVLSVMGVLFAYVVTAAENLLMPWRRKSVSS